MADLERYVVLVTETDEGSLWYFACWAEDARHAVEQALDHRPGFMEVISVYERVPRISYKEFIDNERMTEARNEAHDLLKEDE
jgi:hypothetical protein